VTGEKGYSPLKKMYS